MKQIVFETGKGAQKVYPENSKAENSKAWVQKQVHRNIRK